MDERLRICLWMVGGGIFGSMLGVVFGGLTGALYWRSGGSAGTRWARRVAEAFLDTSLHPPSPTGREALVGAVDGFFFLGIVGLIGGAFLGLSGRSAGELLMPIIAGSVLLVGGAIFFGTLAYALTYRGARFLYGAIGGMIGCWLAGSLLGSEYGFGGLVIGLIFGQTLCLAVRRYSPKSQPPQVHKTTPQSHSDANTDITAQQPSQPNDEFFREPDES